MPVTIRNTDILFNDGTTQSTAATGPAWPGEYNGAVANNTSYPVGTSIIAVFGGGPNTSLNQVNAVTSVLNSAFATTLWVAPSLPGGYVTVPGTWRNRGVFDPTSVWILMTRTA